MVEKLKNYMYINTSYKINEDILESDCIYVLEVARLIKENVNSILKELESRENLTNIVFNINFDEINKSLEIKSNKNLDDNINKNAKENNDKSIGNIINITKEQEQDQDQNQNIDQNIDQNKNEYIELNQNELLNKDMINLYSKIIKKLISFIKIINIKTHIKNNICFGIENNKSIMKLSDALKIKMFNKEDKLSDIIVNKLEDNNTILGYVQGYDYNLFNEKQILEAIVASLITCKKQRYTYIYDVTCKFLDDSFCKNNICEFKNDVCACKKETGHTDGCCHYLKFKILGLFYKNGTVVCKHFNKEKKTCNIKCLKCKMFTCDYIRKEKGFTYTCENLLLIRTFFNRLQKLTLMCKPYTSEENIIKILLLDF